ncbi:MAG: carboxypeptidase regulatory-like domain-containing protein [Ruminiclostridium sp.]|nr:carboxypeptidase regulatory-like domain-containing protein [Ruminiclostridium sp.]
MERFGSPSRRIVMRLSVTVQLIDDLTGLTVKGSNARVWIEGQKPPIVKPDGRYIFVNVPPGEYTVNAEGGIYALTAAECKIREGKADNITLRLLPNKNYPVPEDIIRIEGRALPGVPVRFWLADRGTAYKLLSDAAKGSTVIGIYHNAGINIEGRLLKVISPDDKSEYIRITGAGDGERSEYLLGGSLGSDFPKIGTIIVPVSECVPGSDGSFMMLLKGITGGEMICEYQKGKKTVQKKIDISGSGNITIDLTK